LSRGETIFLHFFQRGTFSCKARENTAYTKRISNFETEEKAMEERKKETQVPPIKQDQGKDLDDLIFRGEGWLVSDR